MDYMREVVSIQMSRSWPTSVSLARTTHGPEGAIVVCQEAGKQQKDY